MKSTTIADLKTLKLRQHARTDGVSGFLTPALKGWAFRCAACSL